MTVVADDLDVFIGFPPHALNVYFTGGVLIDSGTRFARRRLLRELRGRDVRAVSLTHGHADHQGSAHRICATLGIPLYCPAGEADSIEAGEIAHLIPDNLPARLHRVVCQGPGHPVARRLREGDQVGDFVVIETPGHSPGHISYWREADGVLIVGDAIFSRPGGKRLAEAPAIFTTDPATNRASIRRLAKLEPRVLLFNHGPAVRDMDQLNRLVDALPPD
jgi:hydroxyacylglutathione hydrolase